MSGKANEVPSTPTQEIKSDHSSESIKNKLNAKKENT
tara:strand:+ start:168 stop:278 length:111 start_codon:yes stop_codon:yes gene_type:complete